MVESDILEKCKAIAFEAYSLSFVSKPTACDDSANLYGNYIRHVKNLAVEAQEHYGNGASLYIQQDKNMLTTFLYSAAFLKEFGIGNCQEHAAYVWYKLKELNEPDINACLSINIDPVTQKQHMTVVVNPGNNPPIYIDALYNEVYDFDNLPTNLRARKHKLIDFDDQAPLNFYSTANLVDAQKKLRVNMSSFLPYYPFPLIELVKEISSPNTVAKSYLVRNYSKPFSYKVNTQDAFTNLGRILMLAFIRKDLEQQGVAISHFELLINNIPIDIAAKYMPQAVPLALSNMLLARVYARSKNFVKAEELIDEAIVQLPEHKDKTHLFEFVNKNLNNLCKYITKIKRKREKSKPDLSPR